MTKEIWKDIKDYEGIYQVSNLGRVKSLKHSKEGKILKGRVTGKGYLSVVLFRNSVRKSNSIHRLVAQAFIPNPANKPEVNHIDENKLNNDVSNLEWVTSKENSNHGTRNLRIHQNKAVTYNRKPIICVTNGVTYASLTEACKSLGVTKPHVCSVLKGKRKTTKGYVFKYLNEGDNK